MQHGEERSLLVKSASERVLNQGGLLFQRVYGSSGVPTGAKSWSVQVSVQSGMLVKSGLA
jgi:hypothetical protein